MSKSKDQGTRLETWIVSRLNGQMWGRNAERLAEQGRNDLGDVRFVDGWDQVWYIEAKAREVLNVTRELAKAMRKSGSDDTVLVWKRLVKTGKKKRQPDGVPVVVVMSWESYEKLTTTRRPS